MSCVNLILVLFLALPLCTPASEQLSIPALDALPALPQPYILRDWKQTAHDFDTLVFDFTRRGQYLPAPWWDTTRVNINKDILALPAYIGHGEQTGLNPGNYETITCLAALVSATKIGLNKAPPNGTNWVELATGYFSSRNGESLYLNRTAGTTGISFWYELLPSILFYQLYDGYRSTPGMEDQFRITADRWREACRGMGGSNTPWTIPNFRHTAFNLKTGQPLDNGLWVEADSAAAIAWIETMAASHLGEPRYRDAAEWGLQYLDNCQTNPLYECLLPYGALAAARANAEQGTRHDVGKLLNWCFDGSNPRKWGMLNKRFGDTDCHGLIGSVYGHDHYAFAMNTFSMAATLAPVVRYDTRYAAAIGKWLLNVSVRARLFYPDAWPANYQTGLAWQRKNIPENCVAYEGLREQGGRRVYPAASWTGAGVSKGVLATNIDDRQARLVITPDPTKGLEQYWRLELPPSERAILNIRSNGGTNAGPAFLFEISSTTNGPWGKVFALGKSRAQKHWYDIGKGFGLTNAAPCYLRVSRPPSDDTAKLNLNMIYVDIALRERPFAMGDPTFLGWGKTDFGLYGSAFVGQFAALVETTDVEGILRFDLRVTDSFVPPSWPTYLFYNPHPVTKRVACTLEPGRFALYDAATHRFITRNASRKTTISISPGCAMVLVICPEKGAFNTANGRMTYDGRVIDYGVPNP
jgi:hypothetical protein